MSTRILLAPYAAILHTGSPNPKNPPLGWWEQVVSKLDCKVTQIGGIGESQIQGTARFLVNLPLQVLREVVIAHDLFLTVDSFLPHFVYAEKLNKRGVVVFSQSSPAIFGHPENINLLKGEKYLRHFQFQSWADATYNADAFVSPEEVVNACLTLLKSPD